MKPALAKTGQMRHFQLYKITAKGLRVKPLATAFVAVLRLSVICCRLVQPDLPGRHLMLRRSMCATALGAVLMTALMASPSGMLFGRAKPRTPEKARADDRPKTSEEKADDKEIGRAHV